MKRINSIIIITFALFLFQNNYAQRNCKNSQLDSLFTVNLQQIETHIQHSELQNPHSVFSNNNGYYFLTLLCYLTGNCAEMNNYFGVVNIKRQQYEYWHSWYIKNKNYLSYDHILKALKMIEEVQTKSTVENILKSDSVDHINVFVQDSILNYKR